MQNTKDLYLHLLLYAAIKETPFMNFTLMPGEYVSTIKALSYELGISEKGIRVAIAHLVETNDVAIKTTNKYTIFQVQNWDKYQSNSNQEGTQNGNQRAGVEQEDNNIYNTPTLRVREGLSDEENELFEKFLEMWSWQHGKGKRMSPYAEEGQLMNLIRLPKETRVKALNRAITESWKNIHDIRRDSKGRFIKQEKNFDINDPSTWE